MSKKNEETNINKDAIYLMNKEEFNSEISKLTLIDVDDLIKVLRRSFDETNAVNIAVTTENLNGNRNSFIRKLTEKLENSQEELAIAKRDVKHLSTTDKGGRDSRKAIAWVKTLEVRYYKLFERILGSLIGKIKSFNSDDVNSYKSVLKEDIQEQIALLNSDIESLESEAKILKHYNNALRFNNRNTSVIYEKEDISVRSKASLTRLTTIENSGGEIDRVRCEIAELEEVLNILNAKDENSIKDEMISTLNTLNSNLILSFVANFGVTDDLNVIKTIGGKTEVAFEFEELSKKFYEVFMDKQNYDVILEVDQIKPLYLENMVHAIDGYNSKFKTVKGMKTISELEWAIESTKVALDSAKAGFTSEFTISKLEKLVLVSVDPDDYFTTEIDSEFLNQHNDKFKANDLVNLESIINVFNKKIKKTVKNNETRIQIKRLDSRIYDIHKNLYTDIMFWYQQALMPINDLFGTDYELDFTDRNKVEYVLDAVQKEFEKAESAIEKVNKALNAVKSTMRNTLKAFDEEIDGYIATSKKFVNDNDGEIETQENESREEIVETSVEPVLEAESTSIVPEFETPSFESTSVEEPILEENTYPVEEVNFPEVQEEVLEAPFVPEITMDINSNFDAIPTSEFNAIPEVVPLEPMLDSTTEVLNTEMFIPDGEQNNN